MSMQKMRENTKTILWVVVVSFVVTIFAVWGMDLRTSTPKNDPNIIGKVNDVPISRFQYQQLYDQMVKSVTTQTSQRELPYSQREMIHEQVWNNIIYSILTSEAIKDLGITVTDEEVRSYLRNSPPPEIQQYFLDENGNFDNQAYQTALNNPEIDWSNLERFARERIPMQKLQTFLQAMVHVSDSEVRRAYEEENTLLSAQYVEFPLASAKLEDYSPSSLELREYYDEHKDEFKEPEKAVLDVVTFDIQPSKKDEESAKFTIDLVRDQIASGEDFAEMAKTYSELPTAASGGETELLKITQRENEVFAAADSLKIGELSPPIRTASGFYIIKPIEKKTSANGEKEYKIQEIFVKVSAGYETLDSLQLSAQELLDEAKEVGLKKAAEKFNLTVLTTEPFIKGYPISGLGFVPKLSDFAFTREAGSLSGILRDDRRLYVASLAMRIPETTKPLSEIEEIVVDRVKEEKRKELVRSHALSFYTAAKNSGFEEAAKKMQLAVHSLNDFYISDNLERFGSYSALATAVFSINEGAITPPILDGSSYFVLKLVKRSPFNEEDYKKKMAEIGNKLFISKTQQFVTYWYEKMKRDGKIEDYRKEY